MSLRRVWRTSTFICLLVAVLIYFYAVPIAILLHTKWELRNDPRLWVVPKPLRLVSAPDLDGKLLSYFGYEFESPWTEVKLERKLESIVILNFSSGQVLCVLDPAHSVDELGLMKREAVRRGVDLTNVLGEEATRSRYALLTWTWSLTPGDLRLLSPRQKMVANSVFLRMKKIWMERLKGGVYSFQTNWLHGIQEGDPWQDDMVIIRAFDTQDHKIELWVGSEKGANRKPTQDEINRVLCSLRPTATSQAK